VGEIMGGWPERPQAGKKGQFPTQTKEISQLGIPWKIVRTEIRTKIWESGTSWKSAEKKSVQKINKKTSISGAEFFHAHLAGASYHDHTRRHLNLLMYKKSEEKHVSPA